jgi:hypothetical protein
MKLPPEPGHLPLGELAGADLNQRNRLSERALSAQVLDNLAVAERLHGGLVLGQAAPQELLRFRHPAEAEHGIDPGVDSALQIRRSAREAELE